MADENKTIYDYGFGKSLNKPIEDNITPVAYSSTDKIDPAEISKGSLAINTLSVANFGIISGNDTLKALQVGNVRSLQQYLAPFDVSTKGVVRRVSTIQLASATDLGETSIEPASTTKAIWANGGEVRIQSGTNGYIRHRRTGTTTDLFSYVKSGLTNSSANSVFTLSLSTTEFTGGAIDWLVTATDGTDYQSRTGRSTWAAVNKGGVYTSQVSDVTGAVANSSGTLTGAWSIVTGTNEITLQFTPTSSLTTTSIILYVNFHSLNAKALAQNL